MAFLVTVKNMDNNRGGGEDDWIAPPLLHATVEPVRSDSGFGVGGRSHHGGRPQWVPHLTDAAQSRQSLSTRPRSPSSQSKPPFIYVPFECETDQLMSLIVSSGPNKFWNVWLNPDNSNHQILHHITFIIIDGSRNVSSYVWSEC